jgi:predicted amino acid dehydrogenase
VVFDEATPDDDHTAVFRSHGLLIHAANICEAKTEISFKIFYYMQISQSMTFNCISETLIFLGTHS